MSQSPASDRSSAPTENEEAAGRELSEYSRGWRALTRLARKGLSWSGAERNCAFLNLGDGSFADVSGSAGFDHADDGRALAVLDWDLDGDLDLVTSNRSGPRARFLENRSTERGVTLGLRGVDGDPMAIGARVELFLAGEAQPLVRSIRAGEGYMAQSSARVHFGLGDRMVDRIVVHWPGAAAEEFPGIAGGSAFELVQHTGQALPKPVAARVRSIPTAVATKSPEATGATGATTDHAGSSARRIVLARPMPLPKMTIQAPEGDTFSLFGIQPGGAGNGTGHTILINLWASWCGPCITELEGYAARAEEIEDAHVAFLALSVDTDRAAAEAVIDSVAWPFRWALAPERTIEVLDAIQAAVLDHEVRMPLPTSFLVDRKGALRVIYLGPVDPDQLLMDERLVTASPAAQRDAAVPFAGTWYRGFVPDGAELLRKKFESRGLEEEALEASRAAFEVVQTTRAQMLHKFARQSAARGRWSDAMATLREAVAEDPLYVPVRFDLGVLLHGEEKFHEAIGAYLKVLELDPTHRDANFNLGLAYIATLQYESAGKQSAALRPLDEALADQLDAAIEQHRAEHPER